MIQHTFTEKIASGQIRVAEMKVKWMLGRNSTKSIKFNQLIQGNRLTDIRPHIKALFP
jgi:hypothetical protein